ncbi:TIGR03085 family protein [Rhodococcoides trifolii]|uniref:TIGR03085 family protein n=1 Tax=Rhodococcoides trifolii TaxID=908250 RepID=A0A917FVY0_9NOCA|nr:TIGR03085 family metal-binding protein [Rhodococcus trifolii]GGG07939.1 TIGR03085 family protein [Rhodococcus trifolii]
MSFASRERQDLATTMVEMGPDAPTLCGDWTVRDLAAHLVIRERRFDAMAGIFLPPLAGYTEKVQKSVARTPWPDLVADLRSGPPIWSPYKLLDSQVNVHEMFVHHEDVRRAGPGEWTARTLSTDTQTALWRFVRLMGRLSYRTSPVGVTVVAPGGRREVLRGGRRGDVVLRGEPSELLLHALGRDAVDLEFEGDQADIDALNAVDRAV